MVEDGETQRANRDALMSTSKVVGMREIRWIQGVNKIEKIPRGAIILEDVVAVASLRSR